MAGLAWLGQHSVVWLLKKGLLARSGWAIHTEIARPGGNAAHPRSRLARPELAPRALASPPSCSHHRFAGCDPRRAPSPPLLPTGSHARARFSSKSAAGHAPLQCCFHGGTAELPWRPCSQMTTATMTSSSVVILPAMQTRLHRVAPWSLLRGLLLRGSKISLSPWICGAAIWTRRAGSGEAVLLGREPVLPKRRRRRVTLCSTGRTE